MYKFGGVKEEELEFNDININDVLTKMAKERKNKGNDDGFPFRLDWELRDVQDNYIQETKIRNKDTNAPHILMLHGYGCSGTLFYRMVGHLKHYYNITLIDFLGMGCSGRPTYSTNVVSTPQIAIDYFIISIEAWMIKSNYKKLVGTKGCTIVGHSFGAYITSWFAVSQYAQEFLNGIVLLSPAGLPRQPKISDN